jgi:LPS export ABC transporter permease LptF
MPSLKEMKLIDRYVGKQIVVTAAFAVAVLSAVLVLGNVFKQLLDLLVNHDVPLDYILSFIAYIIPFSLTFTIPWGFLTAVLLVFGRMSAENELVALRCSGVAITRICLVVLGLAICCCAICFYINTTVAPRAQTRMKNALFNIATSNPIAMFGSDEVIEEFPGKKIYVGRKEGPKLHNLLMYELNDDGEPARVVHAETGELQADLANKRVLLRLFDASFEQRDEAAPSDLTKIRHGITMSEGVVPISLEELYEKNQKRRGLSQMTLNELLKGSDADHQSAARTEVSKRFSFSLASFAFGLIGVPLAITAHRRETSIGFLLSLIVAFVYFFFIIVADTLRNNPAAHPELLIWLPNLIFTALGVHLFSRLSRK